MVSNKVRLVRFVRAAVGHPRAALVFAALAAPPSSATAAAAAEPRRVTAHHIGAPVPDGHHLEQRPVRGVVVSGSVLFGTSYFLTLALVPMIADQRPSTRDDYPGYGWLALPLAGPWIYLAGASWTKECGLAGCIGGTWVVNASVAFHGIVQALGAGLTTLGLLSTKTYLVRNAASLGISNLALAPSLAAPGAPGISLGGAF